MIIKTENRNPKSTNLDLMSIREIIELLNQEDQLVPSAIAACTDQIEQAVTLIVSALHKGGRLIYIGAGTSGRLGVLDAVECYPTFGVGDDSVTALMAGGEQAFIKAQEGAEDSKELAIADLKNINLNTNDIVCGIAASGRTPYVIGGLEYATSLSCSTLAVTCNPGSIVGSLASVAIEPNPGPEVLTGSTRMKAGTCQKLILNMLSTVSMIQMGKVYENLMIDLKITNQKLHERALRNIMDITTCSRELAEATLIKTKQDVKSAILMISLDCSLEEVHQLIKEKSSIRKILQNS
ncbi:MAG: N-acetylmuramic acid 6-phosphate etherase [Brevinema sp.]